MMGFGHDTVRRTHTLCGPDALRWGAILGVPLRGGAAPSGPLRRHRCHLRRLVRDVRHIPWVFPVPRVATVRGGEADGRSGGGRPTTTLLAGRKLSRSPKEQRPRAHRLLRSGEVQEEWPLMGKGRVSPHAEQRAHQLARVVRELSPKTNVQSELYADALVRLDVQRENRALRTIEVREGIPSVVWVVLLSGALITVGFTYLEAARIGG